MFKHKNAMSQLQSQSGADSVLDIDKVNFDSYVDC